VLTVRLRAGRVNQQARVAYVDNDPVVLAHARALLAGDDRTVVVDGDARDPAGILADPLLRAHVDWTRPTGVIFAAVLHFLAAADCPRQVVRAFREVMVPGSFLIVSHVTPAEGAQAVGMREAVVAYEESTAAFTPRTRGQIQELFAGFDLVSPGLVAVDRWRAGGSRQGGRVPMLAGVARLACGGVDASGSGVGGGS